MDSQANPDDAQQPYLNNLGMLAFKFTEYGANATNNLANSFNSMTTKHWIRIIVIVGGYMLLRPQIMRFMGRNAAEDMEKRDKDEKAAAKAKITPNELRFGKPVIPEEEEVDEHLEGEGTGANWGSKARTRQRLLLRNLMEADEKRRQDEEDDKDIADLLED